MSPSLKRLALTPAEQKKLVACGLMTDAPTEIPTNSLLKRGPLVMQNKKADGLGLAPNWAADRAERLANKQRMTAEEKTKLRNKIL